MNVCRLFYGAVFRWLLITGVYAQAPATPPPAPTALRVIAFAGGWNLPTWVAQRQGFFEQQGLAVQLSFTPSSGLLVNGLMSGRFDLGLASIDNVVAYQEGQGDGPPLLDPDLAAFMAVDSGFLSLVAAPGVKTMADLRQRQLAVDSLNTGFSFVLRELLQKNGIGEGDVTLVRGGATEIRFRDLLANRYEATLLRTPYEILAVERGCNVLATGSRSVLVWARAASSGAPGRVTTRWRLSASSAPIETPCNGSPIRPTAAWPRRCSSPTFAT